MSKFGDSLRGYGFEIHKRDGFTCRYCGADGTKSFATWLTLTVDHLLPPGHRRREEFEYKVTSCAFCNTADNHYFERLKKEGFYFDGLTPEQLVEKRKQYVHETRQAYREFWEENVDPSNQQR